MATIIHTNPTRNLRTATGEELLMLTILGGSRLKARIDRELDRRAHADSATAQSAMPHPATAYTHYAA